MKALVIDEPGGNNALKLLDFPTPEPGEGEVRVQMKAACVNPVDVNTRSGVFHGKWFQGTPRVGLGWDIAGVVSAVGHGVQGFHVGQRVFGMNDSFSDTIRCQAEEVIMPASALGTIPGGLDMVTASVLPMNGSTAATAVAAAGLSSGQRLLVSGASGAVGGFAVSLAKLEGIYVVAVASEKDAGLVKGFGADEVIQKSDNYDAYRGFDAVIDAAMLGERIIGALSDGGTFVSVAPSALPKPQRGIEPKVIFSKPSSQLIDRLGKMAAEGKIFPRVAGTFPLEDAASAYQSVEAGETRARWVIVK